MAQDTFINITADANAASKPDLQDHRSEGKKGTSAAGDLTLSYDSAKFTSRTLIRGAFEEAMKRIAATGLKA